MLLTIALGFASFVAFAILFLICIYRERYFGTDNRHKFFAEFIKEFAIFHTARTYSRKKELFAPLHKLAKEKGSSGLQLLEIGVGSGPNLEFYPENTQLTVVDPNRYFEDMVRKKVAPLKNVTLERFVVAGAENMSQIPDNSIDAVVSTLVLCSCGKVEQVYREICRVLKPGAKFYFMEHVLDPRPFSLLKLGQMLSSRYLGIWPFFFDGCLVDKNLDGVLKLAGFAQVDAKHFYLDLSDGVPLGYRMVHLITPHLYGTATAPQ